MATRLRLRSPADLVSGLMFAAIGAGAFALALGYPAGTMARMGAGMLPLLLSGVLTLVGVALAARSFIAANAEDDGALPPPGWRTYRAALFVLLGLLVFALLVRPLGLFVATAGLVLVSSRAEPGYSLLGAAALALFLAALSAGIFVYGLGLPFRVWP